MSRLGDAIRLSQRISITAEEEASRYDLPEIDVDHLLLAVLAGGGPAGELLRRQGLTLDAARGATDQVRLQHAARLGIVPPPARPRPIRDPSIGDSAWTRRALSVVKANDDPGSELSLLAGLLDEESGLVREVLAAADVDTEAVRRSLADAVESPRSTPPRTPAEPDWRSVEHTAFVPAAAAEVWALVSDPTRRPEWDSTVATVERLEPGLWLATSASNRPDGTLVRVRSAHVRTHHRVLAYVPEETVEWEITFPDRRDRPPSRQRLRIRLEPAEAGTTLVLTLSWALRRGRRRLRQLLKEPAWRVLVTQTLVHHALAISRRLR